MREGHLSCLLGFFNHTPPNDEVSSLLRPRCRCHESLGLDLQLLQPPLNVGRLVQQNRLIHPGLSAKVTGDQETLVSKATVTLANVSPEK